MGNQEFVEQTRDEKQADLLDELSYSQKKSSAVETLFTLTILTFTYLQLATTNFELYGLWINAYTIAPIYGFTVIWALFLGGRNLISVTRKEISVFHEHLKRLNIF